MRLAAAANLILRFFVELAAYAALGYWGASVRGSTVVRTSLTVVAPLIAIVVWSLFLAPKARWRLSDPMAVVLELTIFVSAAIAFASSGPSALAAVFGSVAVVNTVLVRVFARRHPSVENLFGPKR
jgi:hypothetical protein